jgi:hypothetical protein
MSRKPVRCHNIDRGVLDDDAIDDTDQSDDESTRCLIPSALDQEVGDTVMFSSIRCSVFFNNGWRERRPVISLAMEFKPSCLVFIYLYTVLTLLAFIVFYVTLTMMAARSDVETETIAMLKNSTEGDGIIEVPIQFNGEGMNAK